MIDVLDHGYLKAIEAWGSDERIVEAARMSTGKGFLRWDEGPCPACGSMDTPGPGCFACEGHGVVRGDLHLLRRLWTDKHATPFEMAGLVIEVQADLHFPGVAPAPDTVLQRDVRAVRPAS